MTLIKNESNMNTEHMLYLYELLELNFFLGIISFIIGSVLFSLLLMKTKMAKQKYNIYIILQFFISYLLSLIIWFAWNNDADIMFSFISIPAFMAEIIASVVIYLFVKHRYS